jgi:pimeloyl-ACP methyl ester carboxylesterase
MKRKIAYVLLALLAFVLFGPYLIPLPAQPDRAPEDVAPPDGRFVTVGGLRTFVQEAGPADGPAVLLIHGFGGSTFNWRLTLPRLADAGYRAIAIDLKGFGLADKSFDQDFSHAAQADFVVEAMSVLGVQRATLVGHSMGGSVIAHLALKYPERVDGLVFAAAAVTTGDDGARPAMGRASAAMPLLRIPPLRRWAQIALRLVFTPERVTSGLRSAYYDTEFVTSDVTAGALRPQQVRGWDVALLGIMRDSGRNALPGPLSGIRAPVMIVVGENDTWVGPDRGQRLAAAVPAARWVSIPSAGHLLMEEQAQPFNAALLDFLARR